MEDEEFERKLISGNAHCSLIMFCCHSSFQKLAIAV
jgi:hypothetical protein